jgi:Ras-related protein Rab-7A
MDLPGSHGIFLIKKMENAIPFHPSMASRGPEMLKLILLGNSSVGKTCLLNQFVNQEFISRYKATIGSDFMTRQLNINRKLITLQIWDNAGQ